MKLRIPIAIALAAALGGVGIALAAGFTSVSTNEFDPAHTKLVQGQWVAGIGCPSNALVATYPSTTVTGSYSDPACASSPADNENKGLLLAKTGPTSNNASAQATLKDVSGIFITELGYDLRKPVNHADSRGSHCDGGSPRFNVTLMDGTLYFLACNSPAPNSDTSNGSDGWIRLRWGGSGPLNAFGPNGLEDIKNKQVKSIVITFDEGQDTGPDNFGMAILDNIDLNGVLVGRG